MKHLIAGVPGVLIYWITWCTWCTWFTGVLVYLAYLVYLVLTTAQAISVEDKLTEVPSLQRGVEVNIIPRATVTNISSFVCPSSLARDPGAELEGGREPLRARGHQQDQP